MLSRRLWHTLFNFRFRSVGSIMAANCSTDPATDSPSGKRPQFGNRHLTDPSRVFQHNAWDNVEWSEEQESTALRKVQENSAQLLSPEKQNEYEVDAHGFWNKFYSLHENRFFKDRHWLFTEFPELAPNRSQTLVEKAFAERTMHETVKLTPEFSGQSVCSQEVHDTTAQAAVLNNPHSASQKPDPIVDVTSNDAFRSMMLSDVNFPGSSASYRILEAFFHSLPLEGSKAIAILDAVIFCLRVLAEEFKVGCGVGNTVFPILKTNNDPGLFVYCCDFSSTAVDLVKSSDDYDPSRCFAFVHDVSNELSSFPVPAESMDIIILIFVLSAILPDKMLGVLQRLSRLLKPGGQILLRDYGRYDMAQLRFKKGRCLSDNFYVRGDGTRVYFFTQDELDRLLTGAGLEKVQNVIDRRLQVNRGKQLTMYRVWIQCKYHKPLPLK